MLRNLLLLTTLMTLSLGTSTTSAQNGYDYSGSYRDPYTGETVYETRRHRVRARAPQCRYVWANQCGYDAWGNLHCQSVQQLRCR